MITAILSLVGLIALLAAVFAYGSFIGAKITAKVVVKELDKHNIDLAPIVESLEDKNGLFGFLFGK